MGVNYNIYEKNQKYYSLNLKHEAESKRIPIYTNQTQKIKKLENNLKVGNNNLRFSTIFQWDGEGENVYLTGSFCHWNQFFEMKKSQEQNNKFFLNLFLPKGIYQYKFKINDKWKYNSNFPICKDKNGNINNIIDLTKEKTEDKFTPDFSTSVITKDEDENINDEDTKVLSYLNLFNDYSNEYLPIKNKIKEVPLKTPLLYNLFFSFKFLINKNNIGINIIFQGKEENILCKNNTNKKIIPFKKEIIEHFYVNKKNIKVNKNAQNKTLLISTAYRYRYKLITYIYYRPFKNKE
jgi:hypothetical protein